MFLLIQLMTFALFVIGDSSHEETCYDKFEYVFKVMGRLSDLEKKLEIQEAKINQPMEKQENNSYLTGKLEDVTKTLKSLIVHTGSDTYTRWGRTSCPNGSSLVYDGFAAGSLYTSPGAAANYLCLTKEPKWNDKTERTDCKTNIYGAEYEVGGSMIRNLHDHDVPCAVCRVPRNILMIPGRNDCHQNYILEYSGYLMSGSDLHSAATEFVCVDDKPEAFPGTSTNLNGKLFYFVQARCGSLKCPPYEEGKKITCAICSFSG